MPGQTTTYDDQTTTASVCRRCGVSRADTTGPCNGPDDGRFRTHPGAHEYPLPYPVPAVDPDKYPAADRVTIVPRVAVHTWGQTSDGVDVYVSGRPTITVRPVGYDAARRNVCQSCGADVADVTLHALFHATLNRY